MEDAQQALTKANDPEARVTPDERAAEWAKGAAFAEEWRCPSAGHTPAERVDQLSALAQETILDVERLTKTRGCRTCPNAYMRISWVLRIYKLRSQRDKQLLPLVRPRLTAIELACMDAIDVGIAAREEYEWKQATKKK